MLASILGPALMVVSPCFVLEINNVNGTNARWMKTGREGR